ncbi:DUF3277 family protein [Patescibacteria group bacterium]|nr:DUF3277 family protein [Patescibacteria group bacterium]
MTVYRKAIATFALNVGGVLITEGGGEGEYFTCTSPERGGSKTGVHGDAVLYDIPGSIYEVQVTFLESAAENSKMQTLLNAQVSRETEGSLDFSVEDTGTGELMTGQCIFTKEPDRGKTAEVGNYQWTLHVASEDGWSYSERTVSV